MKKIAKKLTKVNVKKECNNLCDDFEIKGKDRIKFFEQVWSYVHGTEVKTWSELYCFVDGYLMTTNVKWFGNR